jgi:type I restriction enzyme, S subunit
MTETAILKDSGIPWIKDIPAHWDVMPLYGLFYEKQVKNADGAEANVLSLSYGKIIKRNIEENFGLLPESFNTYQIVSTGDIIMRLTDLQNDKRSLRVGLVTQKGIITSAYLCLCFRENQKHNNIEYFYYLLHTYDIYKIFYNLGGGVRQSMGYGDLKRMPMLVPPRQEQDRIVALIKTQEGKIDNAIAKAEKEIELMREYKRAMTTEAVISKLV